MYVAVTIASRGDTLNLPKYVNLSSILIIYSLMLISRSVELSGALTRVSLKLIALSRGSPRLVVAAVLLTSVHTASILMNDTALFVYIPLTHTLSRMLSAESAAYAALVTIAVNVSSAMTPIGNPQNVIV